MTAYEVFTGELPWEKATSSETLLRHMNVPGRDPRDFMPDLDTKVAEFLIKSIDRSPADRFKSAEAFGEVLQTLPPM